MAMAALLLALFSLSAISTAAAQIQTPNITLGSSISINGNSTYWVSPLRRFAFGFYPIGNGFMVVLLSTDGRLLLSSDRSNGSLIDASGVASYASVLDSGNFVLYNSNSNIIWQSFNFPTDTIVAGQRLIVEWTLFSHLSETNHSTGRFRIVMHTDGNLVSYPTDTTNTSRDAYWHSDTWEGGKNVSLNLDTNGQLYLHNSTGFTIKNLTEHRTGAFVYRATMDVDGIFRLYSHRMRIMVAYRRKKSYGNHSNWLTFVR
ncbi:G-type lectin S-receptor-like serine/threonine-protein kinase LECRK1 isoform X1 [Cinnamomum micranthum f. kanehirae]|uniref:G-type lectin S-receptor-like serine/threonine-protein kinase LECRK1 isoform X1 n=1 Tax=Cinnamomum micranthum f. kanehirae TaxID=337451 RepID=A0A3S3NCP1_9MAGN|nr:G-type lectin S-receptor-like serine/threonine-protein kinase LECRK1 isoform X1 [Cinnamomum micranthum f. kanehirae]